MNEALRDLIGRRVEIWDARGSFRDRGTLVAFEDPWIRVESDGEVLCFPVQNVRLMKLLQEADKEVGAQGNVIYYLATPPAFFDKIAAQLGAAGLAAEQPGSGWRRIVIEKPFGHDLESAKELNEKLHSVFQETQIYRIDH